MFILVNDCIYNCSQFYCIYKHIVRGDPFSIKYVRHDNTKESETFETEAAMNNRFNEVIKMLVK